MNLFDSRLDPPSRPTLGLVVLQADETIELDFRRLFPLEARLFASRVPSGLEVSPETLATMEAHIPAAAELFPRGLGFDVVGYGCTSATSVIGRERVAELIGQGVETAAVTEPVSALIAACETLGVTRLAFLSPYVAVVSESLRSVLAKNGVETPVFGSFDIAVEGKVAKISRQSVVDAACRLGASDEAEAVFLSCTNLRTVDAIADIEQAIGKPVLSSNQVLAWHMAQLAGLPVTHPAFAQLDRR